MYTITIYSARLGINSRAERTRIAQSRNTAIAIFTGEASSIICSIFHRDDDIREALQNLRDTVDELQDTPSDHPEYRASRSFFPYGQDGPYVTIDRY